MDLGWARELVSRCREAGTSVFVKQLGSVLGREFGAGSHGGDVDRWPEDLRIREFPRVTGDTTPEASDRMTPATSTPSPTPT